MDFALRHAGVYILLLMTVLTSTVKEVMGCPGDEKDWTARAATFNCDSGNGLSYHCIKNHEDKLMEACLPRKKISPGKGGCPWIYIEPKGSIVFGATNTHCDDLTSCPSLNHTGYFTDQLYQYPGCIRSNYSNTKTVTTPSSLKTTESKSNDRLFLEENSNLLDLKPYVFQICFGFIIIIYFVVGIVREKHPNCMPFKICKEGDNQPDFERSDTCSMDELDAKSDQGNLSTDAGCKSEMAYEKSPEQTRQNLNFAEKIEIAKSDTSYKREFNNKTDNSIVSADSGRKWGIKCHLFFSFCMIQLTAISCCAMYLEANIAIKAKENFAFKELILCLWLAAATIALICLSYNTRGEKSKLKPTVIMVLVYIFYHILIIFYVFIRFTNIIISIRICGGRIFPAYIVSLIFILCFYIGQSIYHWTCIAISKKNNYSPFFCSIIFFVVCTNVILWFYAVMSDVRMADQFDTYVYQCMYGNSTNQTDYAQFHRHTYPTVFPFLSEYSFVSIFLNFSFLRASFKQNSFILKEQLNRLNDLCFFYITVLTCIVCTMGYAFAVLIFGQVGKVERQIYAICFSGTYLCVLFPILRIVNKKVPPPQFPFSSKFIGLWDTLIFFFYIGCTITNSFKLTISLHCLNGACAIELSSLEVIKCLLTIVILSIQTYVCLIFSGAEKMPKFFSDGVVIMAIVCLVYLNSCIYVLNSSQVSVVPIEIAIPSRLQLRSLMQFMVSLESMYHFVVLTRLLIILFKARSSYHPSEMQEEETVSEQTKFLS